MWAPTARRTTSCRASSTLTPVHKGHAVLFDGIHDKDHTENWVWLRKQRIPLARLVFTSDTVDDELHVELLRCVKSLSIAGNYVQLDVNGSGDGSLDRFPKVDAVRATDPSKGEPHGVEIPGEVNGRRRRKRKNPSSKIFEEVPHRRRQARRRTQLRYSRGFPENDEQERATWKRRNERR